MLLDAKVDGLEAKPVQVRALLPHEVLHCLAYSQSELVFDSVLLGNLSDSARLEFWQHVKTLGAWRDHPVLAGSLDHLIGFTFHVDGAQMYREDEFMVWSFNSCFAECGLIKDILAFQFPFAIVPARYMRTKKVPMTQTNTFVVLCPQTSSNKNR